MIGSRLPVSCDEDGTGSYAAGREIFPLLPFPSGLVFRREIVVSGMEITISISDIMVSGVKTRSIRTGQIRPDDGSLVPQ